MKVVTRTDEYTIYKKRNQRYAVRRKEDKQWVRGEDKVAILLAHDLVPIPAPKGPDHPEEPEADSGEAGAEGASEEQSS